MPIDVQMPDGTIISGVPDNITQADLLKRYQAYAPPKVAQNPAGAVPDELGRYDAAKQPINGPPVANPQGGFSGALAGGTQQIQADITRLAGKLGIKDTAQAEREAKQYEAEAKKVFKPTEQGWLEAPLTKLAETAGGSLPYMAAPLAAGVAALALPEIGLAGGLIGAGELAAGAVSVGQFTGSNLSRQVQEGKTLEEASLLKAGAAAVPQAALDVIGFKMLPGLRQIFTKAGVEVSEKALEDVAKKGLLEQAGYYTMQTGKTMGAEGLTEAGQQVFERLQAGLDIADEQARKEYFENFVGGALLGGAFSVPGHAYEAIKGKKPEQVIEEAKQDEAKGAEEVKTAPENTTPETAPNTQIGEVPQGGSHDTQAMADELAGKDITQKPAPEMSDEERNRAIEIHNGAMATGYVTSILEKAQQGFIRAGQEYEKTGKSPTMSKVEEFLIKQFSPLMGKEQAVKYTQYLTQEGGLFNLENATNSEYFGEAVNGVKPISVGTPKPVPAPEPAIQPEPPAVEPEAAATEEQPAEEIKTFEPKIVDNENEENGKTAEFDNNNAYVTYFADDKGNIVITDINAEDSNNVSGREIVKWLKDKYQKPIIAYEVDPPASGFWRKMQYEGLVDDWHHTIYRGKTSPIETISTPAPETTPEPSPVPATEPAEAKPEPKSFDINKSQKEIHNEIKGLDSEQLCQWLIDNAPNSAAKHIAEKLLAKVKENNKHGVPVKIEILTGKNRNSTAYGTQQPIVINGKTQYYAIKYNGLDRAGNEDQYTGTKYSTIMHELVHMVGSLQLFLTKRRDYKGDKSIYKDFSSIRKAIEKRVEEEFKKSAFDRHPAMGNIRSFIDASSIKYKPSTGKYEFNYGPSTFDEIMAYGFTDKDFQDFLASIKIGNKTALTKLVEIFRKLLGVDPQYETALDRLLTATDKLFAQTPADKQKILSKFGWQFGPQATPNAIPIKTNTAGFKRFFNGSKVVGQDGKPLVMYHHTPNFEGNQFLPEKSQSNDIGYHGEGFYFGSDQYLKHSAYGSFSTGNNLGVGFTEGSQVIPTFLSIKNPKYIQSYDQSLYGVSKKELKSQGYDGVIVLNGNEIYNAIAFEPNQIKSAIGNTGKFNIKNPDITQAAIPAAGGEARNYKGQPVQASWSFAEDNIKHWHGLSDEKIDEIIYKLQDKQVDTKRVQQIIEKEVGKIDDDLNVYDKEQLYHGRTATGIREYLLNELMPAIKELQKLGLSPQEMREYLHNRHAEERNNKMNEINKNDPVTGEPRKEPWALQDRASGISTADAKAYLANLDAKKKTALEKVGSMFDKMVKETQAILVASGAETQATIDAWNSTYEHYVPLFRIEEDIGGFGSTGSSKGFQTRGKFAPRALGSEKEVQDILGNLIAQRERALIRAEKIKVGRALYALALKNPNSDLWLPVNPDAIKNKEALIAELQSLGFDNPAEIANNLMEEPKSRYLSKSNKIDPNTGLPLSDTEESVRLKIDNLARFGDNVFAVRINGKDRYIFFNQKNPTAVRMVQSLKNLDADSLGQIEGTIGKLTRWFAAVNTQYNPIFGAVNLIRDVGGAMVNLSTTPIAGQQTKVTAGIFPAMRGIINVLRDERKGKTDTEGKWAKAFQEFRKEGGQTGYRDSLIRTDEEMAIVEKQLGKMKEGNAKKAFGAVMGALTDFNDMMENSVRVSAYVAARDKGLSKQQAAIVAKNLTVNFDKKGQLSARINAYYAFFNASVQGTARLAQTLKGPMGQKIIAGGIALGTMQAIMLAAAGYREDEPPEFVRERNFVIPMPDGKYLSIPYPLGLHILPNIGRITTEFVLGGGKNPGKKVANLTGSFMDAFSPVGSSGLSIQSVLPTVLDPIAALESNKDAFGRPIYREDRATNPTPGYMRSRESASEISKQISYFLNLASGGGKYSKGFLSPTADELDYIAGQVTGGVGRELIKTEQAIKAGVTGEELPTYRIPLAGRFIGDVESKAAESQRFYGNITRMADHEHEVKGRQKNKENVMEYYKEHPEARFWQMANNVENQINALNKQKKEFQEKGFPKERIQRIDNQKAVIMKRFNDHIAKYEE